MNAYIAVSNNIPQRIERFISSCLKFVQFDNDKEPFFKFSGSDFKENARTIRRYVNWLKDKNIADVETKRGRSGGYIITFDSGVVKFDNPDTPLNHKIKEPKKFKDSRVKQHKYRGELLRDLNNEMSENGLSVDLFKKYDPKDYGNVFNGYLLGRVYDTYTTCFIKENAVKLGYKSNIDFNYTQFPHKLFGSASLTSFTNLYKELKNKNINPVYYISALYSRYRYISESQGKRLKKPYVNSLLDSMDVFLTQRNYDIKNFNTSIADPHRSIEFRYNPVIVSLTNYFDNIMKKGIDKTREFYKNDYISYASDSYALGRSPESSFGKDQEALETITRNGSYWLDEAGKAIGNDPNYYTEISRLYGLTLKGSLSLYRADNMFDPVCCGALGSLYSNYSIDDCLSGNIPDSMCTQLVSSLMGEEARQKWLISSFKEGITDIIGNEKAYIRKHWFNYGGMNTLNHISSLMRDYLGIDFMVSYNSFVEDNQKYEAYIPYNAFGLISFKKLIQKYNDESNNYRFSNVGSSNVINL